MLEVCQSNGINDASVYENSCEDESTTSPLTSSETKTFHAFSVVQKTRRVLIESPMAGRTLRFHLIFFMIRDGA